MDPYLLEQAEPPLVAAAWAGGAAAVALVVLLRCAKRFQHLRDVAVAGALAAGFLAGWVAAEGMPVTRPLEAWQFLPWIAVVAAAGALWRGAPRYGPWVEFLVLAPAVAYVTVLTKSFAWVAGVGAAIFVSGIVLDRAAKRATPPTFLAAVALISAATAMTIAVSASLRIATFCGLLAGAATACVALARWFSAPARAAVPLVALLLAACSLNGILYADMPITSGVLLALAPLGLTIGDTALRRLSKPWQASAARLAAVAVLAGAAVAIAVAHSPPF